MKIPSWLQRSPQSPLQAEVPLIQADEVRELLEVIRNSQIDIEERLVRVETRLCAFMKHNNVPTHPPVIAHRVRENVRERAE